MANRTVRNGHPPCRCLSQRPCGSPFGQVEAFIDDPKDRDVPWTVVER